MTKDDEQRARYDRRTEETRTIERIDADGTVHTDLWSYGGDAARALIAAGVQAGDVVIFETVLGSQVSGARYPGGSWLWHQTTDELIEQHRLMVEGFRRREREQLEANREDWTRREAALPQWLRERLATFHHRLGALADQRRRVLRGQGRRVSDYSANVSAAIEAGKGKCPKCWGSGKVAGGTDDLDAWPAWEQLPPGSDLAVQLGLVFPIDCPACGGTGERPR